MRDRECAFLNRGVRGLWLRTVFTFVFEMLVRSQLERREIGVRSACSLRLDRN